MSGKNILLIEPKYTFTGNHSIPLSFQKIAMMHSVFGDIVKYTNEIPTRKIYLLFPNKKIDIVYITSMFTYDLDKIISIINRLKTIFSTSNNNVEIKVGGIAATLIPDYIKNKTKINPHIGLWNDIDNFLPYYKEDIFPKIKTATLFTTRGCIRNCGFCAVRTLEPKFHIVKNWKNNLKNVVNNNIKFCHIQDNNFLAAPLKHQEEVINFLTDKLNNNLIIDFNQALDCRLFKSRNAKMISNLKMQYWRFAYDDRSEDIHIRKTIKKIIKHSNRRIRISLLMLYGFKDTPEDLWYRLNNIEKLRREYNYHSSMRCYPMRYQPLDSLEKNKYVGKYWTKELLKGFKRIQNNFGKFAALIPVRRYKVNGIYFGLNDILKDGPERFKEILLSDWKIEKDKYIFYRKISSKNIMGY